MFPFPVLLLFWLVNESTKILRNVCFVFQENVLIVAFLLVSLMDSYVLTCG